MLLPEGNCGIVVDCCFENDFADTGFSEAGFDGGEEAGADVVAAVLFENVDRDYVAADIFCALRQKPTGLRRIVATRQSAPGRFR